MSNTFFEEIFNLSQIKGISSEEIKSMFQDAIVKIFEKLYDPDAELEFVFDEGNKVFKLINHTKMVVEDPFTEDQKDAFTPCIQVAYSDAKLNNPNVEIEDLVTEEVDFEKFPKRVYSQILSLFNQSIREYEKKKVYEKYSVLKGQIVKAKLVSQLPKGLLFNLEDGNEAFMPPKKSNYSVLPAMGTQMDVVIDDVLEDTKYVQIIVSSSENILLEKILKTEIPEIQSGEIEIVSVARLVGDRAKVSVKVTEENSTIDPVGSIIGENGERIRNIEAQLQGEKIEIIAYSDDIKKYIANALAPARVIDVLENTQNSTETQLAFDVIVPDRQHTLAIGRRGNNVILAVELTKAKINVMSYSEALKNNLDFGWNGNISREEVELLEQGQRLKHTQTKRPSRPRAQANLDLNEMFEQDLQQFQSEFELDSAQDFENKVFNSKVNDDFNIDEELERAIQNTKYLDEETEEAPEDEDIDPEPYSKTAAEDYEKIAKTKLKDFHEDEDLSKGIDNIDIDDADWGDE